MKHVADAFLALFPSFLVSPETRAHTEIKMIRPSKRAGRVSAVTLGSRHLFEGTQEQIHRGKRRVSISVLLLKLSFPGNEILFSD